MKNSITANHSVAKSYGWQAQVKLANNQSERDFPHGNRSPNTRQPSQCYTLYAAAVYSLYSVSRILSWVFTNKAEQTQFQTGRLLVSPSASQILRC